MKMRGVPLPSLLAAAGLVGGFAVARRNGNRRAGGAVFAAAGAGSFLGWRRSLGTRPAVGLTALYVAAMGGSHPVAKKIGAWRSVAAATATVSGVSTLAMRRKRKPRPNGK